MREVDVMGSSFCEAELLRLRGELHVDSADLEQAVERAGEQGATVRPFVDWSRLDYVSVLLYDGLPPPEAGEGAATTGAPVAATVPGGAPAPPGGGRG